MTVNTITRREPALESPLVARRRLRRDDHAPEAARNFVIATLANHGGADDDTIETARLLISELVTNAVKYPGRGRNIQVAIKFGDKDVQFIVTDASRRAARAMPKQFDEDSEGGRGWFLVEAMSADCGVDRIAGGNGNHAWFTLNLTGGGA